MCIEALSELSTVEDGRFPTIKEFRRLEACWRTPEFETVAELEAVEASLG
jgi:hypothetical protein